MDRRRYLLHDGPCLDAARRQQVSRWSLAEAEQQSPEFTSLARELGLRSYLAAGLGLGDLRLGALNLSSRDTDGFSRLDEGLVSLFIAPAAAAIVTMTRYAQARDLAATSTRRWVPACIDQALGIIMAESKIDAERAFAMLSRASNNPPAEAPGPRRRDRHPGQRAGTGRIREGLTTLIPSAGRPGQSTIRTTTVPEQGPERGRRRRAGQAPRRRMNQDTVQHLEAAPLGSATPDEDTARWPGIPQAELQRAEAGLAVLLEAWQRAIEELGAMLPPAQVRALLAVDAGPGLNVTGLARMLGASPSATSRLCDRLVTARPGWWPGCPPRPAAGRSCSSRPSRASGSRPGSRTSGGPR